MFNFIAHNPVKLHFGKGVVSQLGKEAAKKGNKALLVYGGGSVKRNGSYQDTLKQLEDAGIDVTEFNGIKPNPLVSDADAAAKLGIEAGVDMVVAVGGGSVIDSAKFIALCIAEKCGAWDIMSGLHDPHSVKPLFAVLTLAATGTEMNAAAVLQNPETRQKMGLHHELMYPLHSFLDPVYTQSVPADYTAYGIVDLIAHSLEAWYGKGEASLSDRFVISVIKEAIEYGPSLMKDLESYELRANIMWAATCALNNTTSYGRFTMDWGVHALGHVLSFLYDTAHGATLSIVYPAWMKLMKERAGDRTLKLGNELFGTDDIDGAIAGMESLFKELGSPIRLQEAGIGPEKKEEILSLMNKEKAQGLAYRLSDEDREKIVDYMFG